jgi:hypothetical protein
MVPYRSFPHYHTIPYLTFLQSNPSVEFIIIEDEEEYFTAIFSLSSLSPALLSFIMKSSLFTFTTSLGFLTIFVHVSGAAAAGGIAQGVLFKADRSGAWRYTAPGINRQLEGDEAVVYLQAQSARKRRRTLLEATGKEDEDATPPNLFRINLQELSSFFDCQDGCTAAFALITSDQCNSTDAQDSALEFKLQNEITFDTTDIESDVDASDYGWATEPFRESRTDATDNTDSASSAPPISLEEFVVYVCTASALGDNQDYNLAVYLYNNDNNETEHLACATLELVTEEEEFQAYFDLFGGGDGGEEGSDVVEGGEGATLALGNVSSPLSGGSVAYVVAGLSIVLSAILFV